MLFAVEDIVLIAESCSEDQRNSQRVRSVQRSFIIAMIGHSLGDKPSSEA